MQLARPWQQRGLLFVCLFWAYLGAALAQDLNTPKRELSDLRQRIERMERALSKTEDSRASALDAAKRTDAEIDAAERELDTLAAKRVSVSRELDELQRNKTSTEARVKSAQKRIAAIYYRNYVEGNEPLVGRLLSGQNPNETGRELAYSSYFARAQSAVIGELRNDLTELKRLRQATSEKADQLSAIAREEKEKQSKLLSQYERQKQQVAALEARIEQQRDSIEEFKRDEAKLTQLIERLTREAAAKQKREAERKRKLALAKAKAKREAQARKAREPKSPAISAPIIEEEEAPEPPSVVTGVFGKLRGRLTRPVAGELAHRFGSPRAVGGLSWKGVFFRAPAGATVKSVAAGEVIFADWLRGFGQLLIVDHGDGYMSLYGNNDGLHKRVGQPVHAGEAIASVGGSGSNAETGLYFELRHRSRALNPMSWLAN